MLESTDRWAAGATYEAYMGRWSRVLARQFVSWLAVPAGSHWLDVGCGTGALTDAVVLGADPGSVTGCDPSEPFLSYARGRRTDERVEFVHAGVGALPERDGGYDAVASLLALNFFPDPPAGVADMAKRGRVGGVVAACVWDYAQGMELLRWFWDAATALDPAARDLDEGERFPICRPQGLETAFREAGLHDVAGDAIEIPTRFGSFKDLWDPLLGGTGPAPAYVSGLAPSAQEALASSLDHSLPRDPGGGIALTARAWAVRGVAG